VRDSWFEVQPITATKRRNETLHKRRFLPTEGMHFRHGDASMPSGLGASLLGLGTLSLHWLPLSHLHLLSLLAMRIGVAISKAFE